MNGPDEVGLLISSDTVAFPVFFTLIVIGIFSSNSIFFVPKSTIVVVVESSNTISSYLA